MIETIKREFDLVSFMGVSAFVITTVGIGSIMYIRDLWCLFLIIFGMSLACTFLIFTMVCGD